MERRRGIPRGGAIAEKSLQAQVDSFLRRFASVYDGINSPEAQEDGETPRAPLYKLTNPTAGRARGVENVSVEEILSASSLVQSDPGCPISGDVVLEAGEQRRAVAYPPTALSVLCASRNPTVSTNISCLAVSEAVADTLLEDAHEEAAKRKETLRRVMKEKLEAEKESLSLPERSKLRSRREAAVSRENKAAYVDRLEALVRSLVKENVGLFKISGEDGALPGAGSGENVGALAGWCQR